MSFPGNIVLAASSLLLYLFLIMNESTKIPCTILDEIGLNLDFTAMTKNDFFILRQYEDYFQAKNVFFILRQYEDYFQAKNDFFILRQYEDYFQAKMKGGVLEYDRLLSEVSLMDLSENKLSGEIPGELVSLVGLLSLNLSGNHLTGEIPQKIGLLHSLESLDLSRNEFTGAIPSSMTSLTFLEDLNLSYNNLLGSIPSGKQFYTFSNQSYIGNPGLCGFPLTKTCHTNGTDQGLVGVNMDEEEAESDMWCFYVSMGPGFVVGFWAVLGTLLLKKNWRIAYFRYIDYIYDRAYVEIAVRGNVV